MVRRYALGKESLVSTVGVADFSYIGAHEIYIDILKRYSSDPNKIGAYASLSGSLLTWLPAFCTLSDRSNVWTGICSDSSR